MQAIFTTESEAGEVQSSSRASPDIYEPAGNWRTWSSSLVITEVLHPAFLCFLGREHGGRAREIHVSYKSYGEYSLGI